VVTILEGAVDIQSKFYIGSILQGMGGGATADVRESHFFCIFPNVLLAHGDTDSCRHMGGGDGKEAAGICVIGLVSALASPMAGTSGRLHADHAC